jgi:NAD-dependent dihydropyrimidine dehydrogenase PreA subunit
MPDIEIILERCVACGDCVEICPQSGRESASPVLARDGDGRPQVGDSAGCISCLSCVEFCRAVAITITGVEDLLPDRQPEVYPSRPVSRII